MWHGTFMPSPTPTKPSKAPWRLGDLMEQRGMSHWVPQGEIPPFPVCEQTQLLLAQLKHKL